jgi:membrane associated rhomboid family serine protease
MSETRHKPRGTRERDSVSSTWLAPSVTPRRHGSGAGRRIEGRGRRDRSAFVGERRTDPMAQDRSATVQTLLVLLVVFAIQTLGRLAGLGSAWFVLSLPFDVRPWTLLLATYAHGGPVHLLANAVGLLLIGPLVERGTSRVRFHAFFAGSGTVAGISQVVVSDLTGPSTAVLGASGAVFALLGYALVGNRVVGVVLNRVEIDRSLTLGLFVAVAAVLTVVTAGPGLALVAHFTGLLAGLVAGRWHLLRI